MKLTIKTQRHQGLRISSNGCAGRNTFDETSIATATDLRDSCLSGRGFTLVELVVAIALLVIMLGFSGVIFKSGIGSYRVAKAQADIMQRLRAITAQLDSDFKGLRKDAPMFIWFKQDPSDPNQRLDRIMFFANGDFQGTRNPIAGNVARIYYGQAQDVSLFARRQHISVFGLVPLFPTINANGLLSISSTNNDANEHDSISLSQWQVIDQNSINSGRTISACLENRPVINFAAATGLHMLFCKGLGSFAIQWSYVDTTATGPRLLWWPSNDPDGNPVTLDSDFGSLGMNLKTFGFHFNVADPPTTDYPLWFSAAQAKGQYYVTKPAYPQALKFTFTLYDSKGIFKDGQTFTHIVYLGD